MSTLFAITLTPVDACFAGRAFAGYGGVYIVGALAWLKLVERTAPRVADVIGSLVTSTILTLFILPTIYSLFGRPNAEPTP